MHMNGNKSVGQTDNLEPVIGERETKLMAKMYFKN